MTKVVAPLFSIAASGPVGSGVSYRRRGRETVAEKRPVVPDARTEGQLRHRWEYRFAGLWWKHLPEGVKAVWRAEGRALGLTGFNAWLRERLLDVPYLAGRWPLNLGSGGVAYDWSGNGNDGTIFGASWADGILGRCLRFDGVDDRVVCGHDASLRITGELSIIAVVSLDELARNHPVIQRFDDAPGRAYGLGVTPGNISLGFVSDNGTTVKLAQTVGTLGLESYHVVGMWYDLGHVYAYIDGEVAEGEAYAGAIADPVTDVWIGGRADEAIWLKGKVEACGIYNKVVRVAGSA